MPWRLSSSGDLQLCELWAAGGKALLVEVMKRQGGGGQPGLGAWV